MISLICGILKKKGKQMILFAEQKDSQTLKNIWLPKGTGAVERDGLRVCDWYIHIAVYGMIS